MKYQKAIILQRQKIQIALEGQLSGEKCKNSLFVPFIIGTEPNTVPDVRRKCSNKTKNSEESVLDKLKEVFEGGQG